VFFFVGIKKKGFEPKRARQKGEKHSRECGSERPRRESIRRMRSESHLFRQQKSTHKRVFFVGIKKEGFEPKRARQKDEKHSHECGSERPRRESIRRMRSESHLFRQQMATKKIQPQKNSDFVRVFSIFMGEILLFGLHVQKRYFSQHRLELSQSRCI